ncbi:MAG: right-handed parallel beta-helix repeat-containing protein, partial [Anaerolineae bacterium]|nr:right-handed parallel beta-helix repeat-containing protein [Anaerolineae bacterium]
AGNQTTLRDLAGATLVAIDTVQGHWVCGNTIVAHNIPAGRVTLGQPCEPGLGWGSKYYVEGVPYLLDSPGEWWYDENSARLYLWPRTPGNPATMDIEITRRENGFSMDNRSYITLDGLTIEFYQDSAVYLGNTLTQKSYHDTVRNATLRYANFGVYLHQEVRAGSPAENMIYGFTLEDSEIGHMDTHAILYRYWWESNAAPDSYTRSGILNTTIRRNEMHHLGFRGDNGSADGSAFYFAHGLRFEGNYVHDVAHNGAEFLRSVIQSPKAYDFEPLEIKTGEILIKDNVFERACQLTTDCGGLKIWGDPPDTHVFRDLLITGNVFRDTFGWAYVSEKRGHWSGGLESDVQGMGGFGLYVDYASGIHAYRNIAYNNAHHDFMFSGTWRDGDIVYYNNIAANSLIGFRLGGLPQDTHGNVNTQLVNNIMVNNEGYGLYLDSRMDYGNLTIDHNLYFSNGWRAYEDGGLWRAGDMAINWRSAPADYFQTLAQIRANTEWETHGVEGNPLFWDYHVNDHDLFDGSWPDFHLTSASAKALDRGTTALPDSLMALLYAFEVTDFCRGQAYDIGRYEGGFAVLASPSAQFVNAGGVARYALQLDPPDLPHPVALTVTSPSPLLDIGLSSPTVTADEVVTLDVTDSHVETEILPALAYTLPITATGAGFTETTSVRLFVGGARVYLPIILRSDLGY